MKRLKIFSGALAMVLLMSGCGKANIGIIGGADGPTAIYVNDNKKNDDKKYRSEKEPVKALMIDGYLYYDTGKESETDARCGTLDGDFTKTVDVYEIPKNNNEANFELKDKERCGYQIGGTEDTIEIPTDDEWEIFKKIYDPEKDVTQYKYIIKVEGETQYSFGETEYIVLSNDLDITANDIAKALFSSLSDDSRDIYVVSFETD